MKFAFCILIALIAVASARREIDWSKVEPRHANPNIPGLALPQSNEINGRITNGQEATPNQFKYQAGLLLFLPDGRAGWCGGSVIATRWIVTAAHCTIGVRGVDVYLGAHNRLNPLEKGQQIIYVESKYITVHKGYDPNNVINDISLIKLPVPIEFNEYVQPARLPTRAEQKNDYVNEVTIASGWGRIGDNATGATDILRWIEVPIMSNRNCNLRYLGSINEGHICISTTGGKSTCNGDSGGPLVLQDGRDTLLGATSFGIALGCEVGWPGVFTRIPYFLDWIEENSDIKIL